MPDLNSVPVSEINTLGQPAPLLTPVMTTSKVTLKIVDTEQTLNGTSSEGMDEDQDSLLAPMSKINESILNRVSDEKNIQEGSSGIMIKAPMELLEQDFDQFPVIEFVNPLTMAKMKKNTLMSEEELSLYQIRCNTCDFTSEFDQIFSHGVEAHQIFICVCCLSYYKFAKELMVHLYREHRMPPQRFISDKEFLKCGGQNTILCCVECNKIFDMIIESEKSQFQNHECKKSTVICPKCGKLLLSSYVDKHNESCKGTRNINLDESTTISTAQLRNRDNSCKFCGKRLSPSKIAAHVRACSHRMGSVGSVSGIRTFKENGSHSDSDNSERERVPASPPRLRRELQVPAIVAKRKKLMPDLNPVNSTMRSNGWKGEIPMNRSSINRSDVEVTVVNSNRNKQIGRISGGNSHCIHDPKSRLESFHTFRNRKRSVAAASFFKDNSDVSITIVPVAEKMDSSSEKIKVNGEIENSTIENTVEDEEDDNSLFIDENDHSDSRLVHPAEMSANSESRASPRSVIRRGSYVRVVDPSPGVSDMKGVERPRRTLRKVTNDDFMYENLSKRSYQRSHSMSIGSQIPSQMQIFQQQSRTRTSFSLSTGAGAAQSLPSISNRKLKLQSGSVEFEHFEKKSSPMVIKTHQRHLTPNSEQTPNLFHSMNEFSHEDEEDEIEPEIKLDPLLLEQDPAKRLLMLIEELCEKLSEEWPGPDMPGYTHQEPDDCKYDITINRQLDEHLDEDILTLMLEKTTINCTYCRQVKLIKIDKRQLAIHLFSKHFWNLRISSIDNLMNNKQNIKSETISETKIQENSSLTSSNTPLDVEDDLKANINPGEQSNNSQPTLIVKTDLLTADLLQSNNHAGDHRGLCPVDLDKQPSSADKNPTESDNINELQGISNKEKSYEKMDTDEGTSKSPHNKIELSNEEPMDTTDSKPMDMVPMNIKLVSTSSTPGEGILNEPVIIDWKEFKLTILKKVFLSKDVLFSYKDAEMPGFGESPCECLLCGYLVDSQKNLFPHWRKIHRGVAMKCAMCQGRFLFAGALFSHLCLGTPNPIIKNETEKGASLGTGGKHPPNTIADSNGIGGEFQVVDIKDDDGSADTIVLRYQCNICDNVQLPGFFNYMVHLRKEHNRCELCLEGMKSQKELEHHMKKHKLNHFCWKCGVTYCAKPNFMTHLFWKHGSESKDCSVCLKKKWPHIYHFCVPPTAYICESCGFYFTKPKCLIVHRRLHTGEKLKKCPKYNCVEKFISKKLLDKHLETSHNPNAPLAICNEPELPAPVEDSPERNPPPPPPPETKTDAVDNTMVVDPVEPEEESQKENQDDMNDDDEHQENDDKPQEKNDDKNQETDDKKSNNLADDASINPSKIEPEEETKTEKDDSEADTQKVDPEPGTIDDKSSSELIEKASKQQLTGEAGKEAVTADEKTVEDEEKKVENAESLSDPDEPKKPFNLAEIQGPNLSEEESEDEVANLTIDLNTAPDLLDDGEKIKHHDDFGSMSPLLPPLEDFNFNVPDIPTFEDNSLPEHIIRENAMFSLLHEHDYCLRIAIKRRPSSPPTSPVSNLIKPMMHMSPTKKFEVKQKKLKVMKPKKKSPAGRSKKKSHSRKRHRSSSSSSSSSSSCSSCGSNCSCSSSSSSSSSSSTDDSSSDDEFERRSVSAQLPLNHQHSGPPVKRGRGRPKGSINRNKDGIPTAKKRAPGGAGKRIGRLVVPKSPKPTSPYGSKPKRKYRKIKGKFGKKSAHHEKESDETAYPHYPEENFILETDLDTDDSGSEEIYNTKQLAEVIGKIPAFDEIWTMNNEQYLLKFVRGVKDLEELRPPTPPPMPKRIHQVNPTYSVKQTGNPDSRLKVRNVPIKPLIVKRNLTSEGQHSSPQFVFGNTPLIGPCSLKTTVVSKDNKTSLQISRESIPNTATAAPASALVLGRRVNFSNVAANKNTLPTAFTSLSQPQKESGGSSTAAPEVLPPQNLPGMPIQTPVRRPRMKIGTGRGGKRSNISAAPVISTPVMLPMEPNSMNTGGVDEQLYCICQCPHDNVSQMIGCDAKDCEFQWFHFECVGVTIPPKGKWYCPDCRDRRKQKAAAIKKERDRLPSANDVFTT